MLSNSTKGSQWRKWDLHVHTPASFQHSFTSWEDYVTALEAIDDVPAIGITDYFSIDGYKEIKKCRGAGRLKNFALIVPNIELRLNVLVPKRSEGQQPRKLNLHVIFSDEVSVDTIETQFLQALEIVLEGVPGKASDKRMLTRASIEEVGQSVKRFQADKENKSDFAVGCMNIAVSLENVTAALHKVCFEGKYLIVLATADWDQIDWSGQDYLTRKLLLQTAHGVFCGQESTIKWMLGQKENDLNADEFRREFGTLKPSLHGSDAHSLDRLCKPENGRFCWIKADPTFEGLKQVVYEPELRVKVHQENPAESETYSMIKSASIRLPKALKITDDLDDKTDFCLSGDYNLEFSNNLTCIIGGRGTGKSTLAHIIYSCWANCEPSKLEDINSPLLSLDMPPNPLRKVSESTECEVPSQTEFFFQNEIEQAARSIEPMSDLVKTRLQKLSSLDGGKTLEELRSDWELSSDAMDELIAAYDESTSIDREILDSQQAIATLRKQAETITSEEYKNLQSKIAAVSAEMADFKSYKSEYDGFTRLIDSLLATIGGFEWSEAQGSELLSAFTEALKTYRERFKALFEKYAATHKGRDLPGELVKIQKELADYLKPRGLSPENVRELAEAGTKIKEMEQKIRLAERKRAPYKELYARRDTIVVTYKSYYEAYTTRLGEVGSSLQGKLAGLSVSKKEVTFSTDIDQSRLTAAVVEFVKTSLGEAGLRSDALERLLFGDADPASYVENVLAMRERVNKSDKAEKHRQIIQEHINDDIFLEKIHLLILKHFFSINNAQIQTRLGGKLLRNTSFGERCGIAVAILLVAGTNPLLIDQPEDHLDGKFISTVLVPLLRRQKQNRQIILVTRDANVVVGADAELIHILELTGERAKILPSTIENVASRDEYIWILDGGAEAFARREEKYDLKLLRSRGTAST